MNYRRTKRIEYSSYMTMLLAEMSTIAPGGEGSTTGVCRSAGDRVMESVRANRKPDVVGRCPTLLVSTTSEAWRFVEGLIITLTAKADTPDVARVSQGWRG